MKRLSRHEQSLLHQLQHSGQRNGGGFVKQTACEFVLEYGWWYKPGPLPKTIKKGPTERCFRNAFDLAVANALLIYCEGYAFGTGGVRIHHAWVTDGQGRALDSTWRKPGVSVRGRAVQG